MVSELLVQNMLESFLQFSSCRIGIVTFLKFSKAASDGLQAHTQPIKGFITTWSHNGKKPKQRVRFMNFKLTQIHPKKARCRAQARRCR